jgi:thiol-disulfide isomerase/thioredoxin
MPDTYSQSRISHARRARVTSGACLIAASVAFGGLFDISNAFAQGPCTQALALSSKIAPLVTGDVAALTVATKPLQLPDLAFVDAAGSPRKLSDWKGRTVLLNLWATWCVPCRKEMPALDNLQGKLGGKLGSKNFEVVAVNIDTSGADKPKAFLKDGNLTRLDFFSDQKAKVFQDLKSAGLALGMPTSVLIDGEGCEIAAISGGAGWDSDEAVKLITAVTAP